MGADDSLTQAVGTAETLARLRAFAAMLPPEQPEFKAAAQHDDVELTAEEVKLLGEEPGEADRSFCPVHDLGPGQVKAGACAGPGACDTSPVGTPGGRQNWVDKVGGLPPYIRAIAHALIRNGKTPSSAIAIAVGTVKRWAAGGGKVSAAVKARAAAALAAWEAKKGASGKKGLGDAYLELAAGEWVPADEAKDHHPSGDFKTCPRCGSDQMSFPEGKQPRCAACGYHVPLKADAKADGHEGLSYKEAKVSLVTVEDADQGVVSALVSVTGLLDRVNDIIEPGAYAKSLAERTPKGVWSHDWDKPISKTLECREVLPGDPMLKGLKLRDGSAWPANAGALYVKTQFNLTGDRGRQAFADVTFFADEQEWSIGYNVPVGGAKIESGTGVRRIKQLDLYEYSPVLFGAMPSALTLSVKSAQAAFAAGVRLAPEELERHAALREGMEGKAAAFNEALHPRAASGEFATGSGYKSDKQGTKTAAEVSTEQTGVKAVQAELVKLGLLDPKSGKNGGVDGLYGPATTAAITAFQKKEGLPQTGTADKATQAALTKASAGGGSSSAAKPAAASSGSASATKPATAAAAPAAKPAAGASPASTAKTSGAAATSAADKPAVAKATDTKVKTGTEPTDGTEAGVPATDRPGSNAKPDVEYSDGTGTGWDYKPGPSSIVKGTGEVQEDGNPLTTPGGASAVGQRSTGEMVYSDGSIFTAQGWSDDVATGAAISALRAKRTATRAANGLPPLPEDTGATSSPHAASTQAKAFPAGTLNSHRATGVASGRVSATPGAAGSEDEQPATAQDATGALQLEPPPVADAPPHAQTAAESVAAAPVQLLDAVPTGRLKTEQDAPMHTPDGGLLLTIVDGTAIYDDGGLHDGQSWMKQKLDPKVVKKVSDARNVMRESLGMAELPLSDYALGKVEDAAPTTGSDARVTSDQEGPTPGNVATAEADKAPAAHPPVAAEPVPVASASSATSAGAPAAARPAPAPAPAGAGTKADPAGNGDDDSTGGPSAEDLAASVDAVVDVAVALIGANDIGDLPTWGQQLCYLLLSADGTIDDLLVALDVPDPDQDDDGDGEGDPWAGLDDETKDVSTGSAPSTTTGGFKGGISPHRFAPAKGKCKVCGKGFAGHMAEQRRRAAGKKGDPVAELSGALERLVAEPGEVKKAGWAPCPTCGGTNRDEYADGTARCEDDGTALTHAEGKAGRVLSGANATALQKAYETLGELLRKAGVLAAESDPTATAGAGEEQKSDPLDDWVADPSGGGTESAAAEGEVVVEVPATEEVTVPVADVAEPEVKSAAGSLVRIGEAEVLRARRLALSLDSDD